MQTTDYQAPKIRILMFDKEDVISTSEIFTPSEKTFDQGVADFFFQE